MTKTATTVAGEVHAFLRDQILSGQDEGLTLETPLLELGILDSFGLFKLLAHLNGCYPIDLRLEEVEGAHFRSIGSISQLVAQRLAASDVSAAPAAPAAGRLRPAVTPRPAPEGVAIFEAPECAQVFVMFTGLGGVGMPGHGFNGAARDLVENTPEFFRRANLGDRNLLLFHDQRGLSYKFGICAELPSREAIQAWVADWITRRPHIEEIFCIGVSAGGPMAMLTGNLLRARTVWSFAPRPALGHPFREFKVELEAFVQRATGKPASQLMREMTPGDEARIDEHVTPEFVCEYYATLGDPHRIIDMEHLEEVERALMPGNGVTKHRLYFVPEDVCDALVAHRLEKCANVSLVEVAPNDGPEETWAFSRWVPPERWVYRNHLVVDLLRQRDIFGTLFPPFRPTAITVPVAVSHS